VSKILQNVEKNETIVRNNASLAAIIVLILNTIANVAPQFWDWLYIPSLFFLGIVILVLNVGSFTLLYFIISQIHKLLWYKVVHRSWDLRKEWHVIQTDDNKPTYLRVGKVCVTQNYYQVHMTATTYDVRYDNVANEWVPDKSESTEWKEDLFLSDDDDMCGLYSAKRASNEIRRGFHDFKLEKHSAACKCDVKQQKSCMKSIRHINGTFCDIVYAKDNDSRVGIIRLYREYEKFDSVIIEICRHICKKHPEVLENGVFHSKVK